MNFLNNNFRVINPIKVKAISLNPINIIFQRNFNLNNFNSNVKFHSTFFNSTTSSQSFSLHNTHTKYKFPLNHILFYTYHQQKFYETSNNTYTNGYNQNNYQKENYTQNKNSIIKDILIRYLRSLIYLYFVHECVFEISTSEGPSMLPTLSNSGDYLFIDKLSSKKNYRKGKVVIAKPQKLFFPNYSSKRNYKVCKRIVGEPNERIIVPFIIDDCIDGQLISYIREYEVQVPEGHVWLQGDNIYDSVDSRDYGPVPLEDISGIVRFKVHLFS